MSKRIGNVVIIAPEPPAKCEECGTKAELRPYGKGGARICFNCAMSTPEKKAETERNMSIRLFGEGES